jgi:hypothetical protein
MAKRPNDHVHSKPNSNLRVRWVEVEVNGADTTIEEALRAVERMRRPVIDVVPAPKRISNAPANGDETPLDEPALLESECHQIQFDGASPESPHAAPESLAVSEPPRKKRGEGDPKDRNAGIKPLGDIDFVPAGKESLKNFFAEKAPGSDMDRVLVLWLGFTDIEDIRLTTVGDNRVEHELGFAEVGAQ